MDLTRILCIHSGELTSPREFEARDNIVSDGNIGSRASRSAQVTSVYDRSSSVTFRKGVVAAGAVTAMDKG